LKPVLITGGSGFFGSILKSKMFALGIPCVNVDLCDDPARHPLLESVRGDIRNEGLMTGLFEKHRFEHVFHLAALLAHNVRNHSELWDNNVNGTRILANVAARHRVRRIVYLSSNCLWGRSLGRPVTEEEPPCPVEIYGRSKLEGEKILLSNDGFDSVVVRCPTIIDSGRLGLLSILFEFIAEGRRVWVVGGGENRYQFIFAQDLAAACIEALEYGQSDIFNIGSDHVKPLRTIYEYVIQKAGSRSRTAALPKGPTLAAMRLGHMLGVSPLGPYHYKMIAESFVFDTSKIKSRLNWKPTVTNEEMLWRAYEFYRDNKSTLTRGPDVPAHRQPAKLGAIALLKWLS
jgi:nucleoside-diphosphate-sugar epimerase